MQQTTGAGRATRSRTVSPAHRPSIGNFLICYICGRQFTESSLAIHERQCLEKWHRLNNDLPKNLRRPRPRKPEALLTPSDLTREEMLKVQTDAARENLAPCNTCHRRFTLDRIETHSRCCRRSADEPGQTSDSDIQIEWLPNRTKPAPVMVPSRNVPDPKKLELEKENDSENGNDLQSGPTVSLTNRSSLGNFVFCYICGRQFTDASLPIHEPQCLDRWDRLNNDLPKSMRRPRPRKPEALSNANNLTREQIQQIQLEAANVNLAQCSKCQRRFTLDRIETHENACSKVRTPPSARRSSPHRAVVSRRLRRMISLSSPDLRKLAEQIDNQSPLGNFVFCYICGRQFTDASLPIHEPQCLDRWDRLNNDLPKSMRRPRPRKPQALLATGHKLTSNCREEMQQIQMEAANDNLAPCSTCQRRFTLDRIETHENTCSKVRTPPSSRLNSPQRVVRSRRLRRMVSQSSPDLRNLAEQTGSQSPLGNFVFCYICGRQFTDASLPIHEPQCLDRWDRLNNDLPKSMRRPRPRKPQALLAGADKLTRHETRRIQMEAARDNLAPCSKCQRRFTLDRIEIHERCCPVRPASGRQCWH